MLAAGLLTPIAPGQQPQTTFRAEVGVVNIVFSAIDRHKRFVSGLKAGDFTVLEDKQRQGIEYFSEVSKQTGVPLRIALLIDTSGSVGDKLEYEKQAAAGFLRTVLRKETDLALLMQFDSEVNLVQDFTRDHKAIVKALGTLSAASSTSLYDAIFLAVNEKFKQGTGRKVVVVISDGDDTSSRVSKELAIKAAQQSDVIIYGIGVRGGFGAKFGVLKSFAEETGGRFFSPRANLAEMEVAFQQINEDLRGQYSLAYTSTNKRRDGVFRKLEVRCRQRGVRVRTRKGYYAPKE